MTQLLLLDSGPLGLVSGDPRKPQVAWITVWLESLEAVGFEILIPEIADYEIRRELTRVGATAGLRRLDSLHSRFAYLAMTTGAFRRAAEFWAEVRRQGLPTASSDSLDADCILAAQAVSAAGSDDTVTIATTNVGHLSRFPGIDIRSYSFEL